MDLVGRDNEPVFIIRPRYQRLEPSEAMDEKSGCGVSF